MRDGRHDFDFLHGTWQVHNRRLASRLTGSEEWHAFASTAVVRPILHGLGNTDVITVPALPGVGAFEGATLRLFDPASGTWSLHWASTLRPGQLDPPLTGRFDGPSGAFHGRDELGGRPIRVRFLWEDGGGATARWSQSFSAGDDGPWELNWVMEFRRDGCRRPSGPAPGRARRSAGRG